MAHRIYHTVNGAMGDDVPMVQQGTHRKYKPLNLRCKMTSQAITKLQSSTILINTK
jgi:hypothetical protein